MTDRSEIKIRIEEEREEMVVGGVQTAHIILPGLRYQKPFLPELFVQYFCLPNDAFIPP
jgi:hypothetical protein